MFEYIYILLLIKTTSKKIGRDVFRERERAVIKNRYVVVVVVGN